MDKERSTEVLEKIWNKIPIIPHQKDSKILHMRYSGLIERLQEIRHC